MIRTLYALMKSKHSCAYMTEACEIRGGKPIKSLCRRPCTRAQLQSRLCSFPLVSSSAPQRPPQTQCEGENSGRMSGRVSIRSCPLSFSLTGSNATRLESPSRVDCRAASGFTPPLPGREGEKHLWSLASQTGSWTEQVANLRSLWEN